MHTFFIAEMEIIVTDWIGKMLGLSDGFISKHGSNPGGGIILVCINAFLFFILKIISVLITL